MRHRLYTSLLIAGLLASGVSPALAESTKTTTTPVHSKAPSSPDGDPLELTNINHDAMMLKNVDQINLLNVISNSDISQWPPLLKKNHACVNDGFVRVMALRASDAMQRALATTKDEQTQRKWMEIAFRYTLLADLSLEEMGQPSKYQLELARKFYEAGAYATALNVVGNVTVREQITHRKNLEAHLLAGDIRVKMNDLYGALKDYQEVVKLDSKNDRAWYLIGRAYLVMGDMVKSHDAVKNAVAINPNNKEAKALLQHLENPTQVPPPSDISNDTLNPHTSDADQAASLVARAEASMRMGHLQEAQDLFNQALKIKDNCWSAHMGLGDLSFRKSDFYKAVEEYDIASKMAPDQAEPLRYKALACEKVYDETGNMPYLDQGINALRSAITIKPNYPEARADQERLLQKKTDKMK
jgi:tetratricopeptide (TPR) repeat protein